MKPVETCLQFGHQPATDLPGAAGDEDYICADVTFAVPVKSFSASARLRALAEARRVYGHLPHFCREIGPGAPVQWRRNGVEIIGIPLWQLTPEHQAQWPGGRKAYDPQIAEYRARLRAREMMR